jgi:orotate phosphoribosyltransferase
MEESKRNELISLIKERSFKTGTFKLASGKMSNYYFNLKPTYCHPDGGALIGDLILEIIQKNNLKVDTIGGMEIGALPIAFAVQGRAYLQNKKIFTFFVRKQKKEHGAEKQVEGILEKDMDVIVVEDVTTTGGSTMKAIEAIRSETGANVVAVISVLNRREGADDLFKENKIPLYSIVAIEDFEVKK